MMIKMKKAFHISLCMILLAGLTACMKSSLLDQDPIGVISDATFWKTPNDLKLYCNNFYRNFLPTNPSNNASYYLDNNSDNLCPAGRNTRLNGEGVVPASGGHWTYDDWWSIRDVNHLLTNYGTVSGSPDEINPYIGEAYFFRAWNYFDKLKMFGELPWINKDITTSDSSFLSAPRLPRNVIADSILADLDKAIAYLPSKGTAAAMRVNKEIAEGFKSRVALYEGSWEKYHQGDPFGVQGQDGTHFLQEAAEAAEAVMSSGLYNLEYVGQPWKYGEIFNQTDYSGSHEVMFWRKYQIGVLTTIWNRYSSTGGGTGMTRRLVDSYLCTDGLPIGVSSLYAGDDSLQTVVRNRDPRLAQVLYIPGDSIYLHLPDGTNAIFEQPGFTFAYDQLCTTGYQLQKGNNTDHAQSDATTRGLIYMRFAEILLNYAEAKAELGTITQGDLDKSINQLRDRVDMPHLALNSITADPHWLFPGLSAIINEVRRERNVEIGCEGFRFDDIMRWAAADELIVGWKPQGAKWQQWDGQYTNPPVVPGDNVYVNAQGYIEPLMKDALLQNGYNFDINRDYLLPVPTDQLTLNSQMKQNPGWE